MTEPSVGLKEMIAHLEKQIAKYDKKLELNPNDRASEIFRASAQGFLNQLKRKNNL